MVPAFSRTHIPVHNAQLTDDRDYLFEPGECGVGLYAAIVDTNLKSVLAENDTPRPVSLPSNCRLGAITECDFDNAFLAVPEPDEEHDIADLAIRQPKAAHKTSWVKKTFAALVGATAALQAQPSSAPPTASQSSALMETTLPNGVTVHGTPEAARQIAALVDEYPQLWTDNGFVDLPEDEWMKIPLKANWEATMGSRIGKAKVYNLGEKDRQLVTHESPREGERWVSGG